MASGHDAHPAIVGAARPAPATVALGIGVVDLEGDIDAGAELVEHAVLAVRMMSDRRAQA
jgi:hypothetical protein